MYIYLCVCVCVCLLSSHSSLIKMLSGVKSVPSFLKHCIGKRRIIQPQVNLFTLLKTQYYVAQ